MISAQGLSRAELRRTLRNARNNLSPVQQRQAALRLTRLLSHDALFIRSRHIAFYQAADGEIDPKPLLEKALKRGKKVYVPVLSKWPKARMAFQPINAKTRWRKNRYGINEPRAAYRLERKPWALSLIFLPLVGFDAHGGRIGMGKGFYDRTLSYLSRRRTWRRPTLIGLAHQCQQVDRLGLANWDIPLDGCASDERFYLTDQPLD